MDQRQPRQALWGARAERRRPQTNLYFCRDAETPVLWWPCRYLALKGQTLPVCRYPPSEEDRKSSQTDPGERVSYPASASACPNDGLCDQWTPASCADWWPVASRYGRALLNLALRQLGWWWWPRSQRRDGHMLAFRMALPRYLMASRNLRSVVPSSSTIGSSNGVDQGNYLGPHCSPPTTAGGKRYARAPGIWLPACRSATCICCHSSHHPDWHICPRNLRLDPHIAARPSLLLPVSWRTLQYLWGQSRRQCGVSWSNLLWARRAALNPNLSKNLNLLFSEHSAAGLDHRTGWTMPSGEQIGAGLRELHIGAGLMTPQPALFNGVGEASTIFGGGATVAK